MKKLLLIIAIMFPMVASAQYTPFNSSQLSTSTATNGYFLQTTGRNNTWVSASSTLALYASSTASFVIDGGRLDTYTPNGSWQFPFKSIGAALAYTSAQKITQASYWIVPSVAYFEGNLTFPATSTIEGNQAPIFAFTGTPFQSPPANISFQTGFTGNDLNIQTANRVSFNDTSLYDPATLQNSFINATEIDTYGLTAFNGGQIQGGLLYTAPNSLTNFVGVNILDAIGMAGQGNLDDVNVQPQAVWFPASNGGYAIMSTTTGSTIAVVGMSLENNASSGGLSNGGGIMCANGATTNPNNLTNMGLQLGTTTAIGAINCGTSATILGVYNAYGNIPSSPTRLFPVLANLLSASFAGLNVEGTTTLGVITGNVGIGNTSPANMLDVGSTMAGGNIGINSTLGANGVTNGTFNTDLTGWSGANWAWNAGAGDGYALHTAGSTAQLASTFTSTAGASYKITFTVRNMTTGSITPTLDGYNITQVLNNGTYVQYTVGSGLGVLSFLPSSAFDGGIDTVSIQLLTNGTLTVNNGINVTGGQLTLPAGTLFKPSLTIGSDPSYGLYRVNGNANIAVAAGGVVTAQFNSLGTTAAGFGIQNATNPQAGGLGMTTGSIAWGPNTTMDTFLTRGGIATVQHGGANSATPVSQTLSVQGSRGGTDTDVAGGNLTIQSGLGTGAATGSTITFNTPATTTTGTTAQVATARMTILGNGNVGIGTTTPSQKLDVNGNVHIEGTTNGILMHDTSNGLCYLVQVTAGVLVPTIHTCI